MFKLLSRLDPVARSQRKLFADFQRQRGRLVRLVRWYDQQQTSVDSQIRRQCEELNKEIRQRINFRSNIAITERNRLKHILDEDMNQLALTDESDTLNLKNNNNDDRKRKVYGCLLPRLKASMSKSYNDWTQLTPTVVPRQSNLKNHVENQRYSTRKFIQPSMGQRCRMNLIIDKCLNEMEQYSGDGYDHFLRTSKPSRNAQILAQQNINNKN